MCTFDCIRVLYNTELMWYRHVRTTAWSVVLDTIVL